MSKVQEKEDPRKKALRENLKRRKQFVKKMALQDQENDKKAGLSTRKNAIETKSATKPE